MFQSLSGSVIFYIQSRDGFQKSAKNAHAVCALAAGLEGKGGLHRLLRHSAMIKNGVEFVMYQKL